MAERAVGPLDERAARLRQMAEEPLDVLVIGGGITGAGIALDAAARGYRVGLVERDDFASGTSSGSTKLVHGGIRYLPELDVALVHEALVERGRLLRNAPYLVQPLPFVLPLYKTARRPVGLPVPIPFGLGLGFILDAGLWLYDVLAGKANVGQHRRIAREQVLERAPSLRPEGLKTGFIYYDAQTDDTRLTLAVLRTAVAHGAVAANYGEATRFAYDGDRISGAYVRDTFGDPDGEEVLIRARHMVNATGVWAEQTERMAGGVPRLHIVPSKGVHLVFARETLGLGDEAVVLPETSDGRILFLVPWQSRVLVGTTDTEAREIGHPVATEADIDYLLDHLRRYLRCKVEQADIIGVFAGNRPLLRVNGHRRAARLSRSHEVVESAGGLISIAGGKLTTYRRMAQDLVDRVDSREGRRPQHPTERMQLAGAQDWADARRKLHARGTALGLGRDVIDHLGGAYGATALDVVDLLEQRPELGERLIADMPYIRAEVVHACRVEMAQTIEDVLLRRTHIALEERTRGASIAQDVAGLMASELGWAQAEQSRQIERYLTAARVLAGPLADRIETDEGADQPRAMLG
jgi:glycerol-3-phosphate dehydrogenase